MDDGTLLWVFFTLIASVYFSVALVSSASSEGFEYGYNVGHIAGHAYGKFSKVQMLFEKNGLPLSKFHEICEAWPLFPKYHAYFEFIITNFYVISM